MMNDIAPRLAEWNLNNATGHPDAQRPVADILERIRSNDELPPLPEITRRLLRLRDDPGANATGLAAIVEQDPLLAGQILRRANSAYYGLRTPTENVRDAIMRALGFDSALALALALAALRPLQTPNQGPIGRDHVWRQGIQTGRLMRELALQLADDDRPPSGLIQLAGLMQNTGYLLLGHLFPDSFRFLSRLIEANANLTLPAIDRLALGVEHGQLGQWLFDVWGMPPALRIVVRHHHNPGYEGEHETLVLLTCLADSLLAGTPWGLGALTIDSTAHERVLSRLDLSQEGCVEALEKILAD